MAKLNRDKSKTQPVKRPRIHWLTAVNTALILGLYAWILLEKLGCLG